MQLSTPGLQTQGTKTDIKSGINQKSSILYAMGTGIGFLNSLEHPGIQIGH